MLAPKVLDRRTLLTALALSPAGLSTQALAAPGHQDLNSRMAALETRSGGRLGVSALDTATGRRFQWRGDQRFRMCSTFKMLLAAHVLRRVDQGRERLDRRIAYGKEALLPTSPITAPAVGAGLTVAQLCEATVTRSDNTAANLLLDAVDGPKSLTRFLRAIGDETTRCDRYELALNGGAADDLRDTTTPVAVMETWKTLLLGDVLSAGARRQLTDWVVANKTGDARLRAGLPSGWRVGDKTGSDGRSITNDIGVAWPSPDRAPVLMAVFHDRGSADDAARNRAVADVARLLVEAGFGRGA